MRFFKNRENEERNFNESLAEIFQNNSNRIYIDEKIVEKLPSVHESIHKIAGGIAQLPLYLYKENTDLSVTKLNSDYRNFLINEENNDFDTAYKLKYQIVRDLLLYGKSYNYIHRKGNEITGIHHVDYKTVTIKDYINNDGIIVDKEIHFTLNNMALKKHVTDFLIIEYSNVGVLNSESLLRLMIEHDRTLESGLKNVARPLGILKTPGRLTQPIIERLRESWQSLYSGGSNAGKTVILEEGLDFKSIDVNLVNLQAIEMKEQFIEDVERLFGLHNIKSDEEFLKRTLSPIINAIESSINKAMLLEREKREGCYFRTDTSELLRPSTQEQYNMIANAVKNGIMTVNEGRQILDLPNFFTESETGDKLLLSLGNVLVDSKWNTTILNLGQTINNNGDTDNADS